MRLEKITSRLEATPSREGRLKTKTGRVWVTLEVWKKERNERERSTGNSINRKHRVWKDMEQPGKYLTNCNNGDAI